MYKYKLLNDFIQANKDLPAQGTEEWKQSRKLYIGGSEISTLLNINPYKNVKKLILERLDCTKQEKVLAPLVWGNVFEELVRLYCEKQYKTKISITGSIHKPDTYLSYSPDGIGVIHNDYLPEFIDKEKLNKDTHYIVLFEYKCPHRREPTGEIPIYYLPQPSIGMNIIDICEISIFIECIYRRCSFKDILYNLEYNNYGHFTKIRLTNNPIEYGFMSIYTNTDNNIGYDILEELHNNAIKKIRHIYDIGTIYDDTLFNKILDYAVKGVFNIEYSYNNNYNMDTFNDYSYIQKLYNESIQYKMLKELQMMKLRLQDKLLICIMPYKLFNRYLNPVYKQDDYIEFNNLLNRSKNVIEYINNNIDTDKLELNKFLKFNRTITKELLG